MTNQELFDRACAGVIKQGTPSFRDNGSGGCAYRGPGGTKCAAGQLIEDADYSPSMEGIAVPIGKTFKVPWTKDQESLVIDLQQAHDGTARRVNDYRNFYERNLVLDNEFVAGFRAKAAEIADKYGLDKTVLGA